MSLTKKIHHQFVCLNLQFFIGCQRSENSFLVSGQDQWSTDLSVIANTLKIVFLERCMRFSILVAIASTTLTLGSAQLWTWAQLTYAQNDVSHVWDSISDREDGITTQSAAILAQTATTMVSMGALEEADYLFASAVRASCGEHGVDHPITESYRRQYFVFLNQLYGQNSVTPLVQLQHPSHP